jgi:three-Cys-motif partner protein
MAGFEVSTEGSPLVALTLRDLFDTYVFSDADEASVEALEARVARMGHHDRCRFVTGDVNHRVDEIAAHIQGAVGERALSFCFLDPYGLNIHFDTVRRLATGRDIDFLILLALHMDAARNARAYQATGDKRIEHFLGDPVWREQWGNAAERGATIVEFLAEAYSARMAALRYLPMPLDQMVKIRSYDKNLPLYYLAFFTRHKTGLKFWKEVLKYANEQLELPLDGS